MDTPGLNVRMMYFVLYVLVGSFGLYGNFTVLKIFRKYRGESAFHIQLAIANMVMLTALVLSGPSALNGKWLFGDNVCKWFGFQVFFAGFATGSFTCLICMESYFAVCYTQLYTKYSKTLTKYISAIVWGYSFLFSVAPLLGWNRYAEDHYASSCGIDITNNTGNNYSYVGATHTVFIVMALVALCSVVMMYGNKFRKTTQPHLPLLNNKELRRVSMVLFLSLGLSSLPYYLRTVYYLEGYPPLFNSFLTVEFSHWFIKVGCLMSSVTYMVFSVGFKGLVKQQ